MFFASVGELWNMAGHGPYVWFSFGVSTLVLIGLLLEARRRDRSARALVAAAARRRRAETHTS
ncbi:heme exporter protein CcmD [Spongiibacter sp.]|uniref:heme exporter protein CcmD n=1 Tax=Spongiibacter sp. TaxID=2024860 RepID=UPI00356B136E